MSLIEHLSEGIIRVRWVREDAIGIEDTAISQSFLLSPDRVVTDWPPRRVDQLDSAALDAVLNLKPELVLLGTGSRQRFASQEVMATFLRKGIGFEVMDNAAAARTYHLLAFEGRRVVVGFLLDVDAA